MSEIAISKPAISQTLKSFVISPWSITLAVPVLVAVFDYPNLLPVLAIATKAFLGTLPYISFAVFLIAYLKAAGAEVMIASAFKGREVRMIFLAAMFGGLAPFCSCEVIPFIAGLLALGAPLSAVMAFWLSSPLIDPPTLLITAGALGWPFAIGKAISAVGLGLMGGFAVRSMIRLSWFANPLRVYKPSGCCSSNDSKEEKPDWTFWDKPDRNLTFRKELVSNGMFLIKWLALAYALEAVLITYVPASMIAGLVGGSGITPIAIAAFVGMPAYLNSYIAPPLLAGLVDQGMSAGAAMSFMVAGAVSSIPAMAAVWSLVKPQVFATYLCLGIVGAITSGVIFQLIMGA